MSEVISSLTFLTNRKEYGPYGSTKGTFFSFKTSNGEIIGFHGTSGDYLNSIGCHVKPVMPVVNRKKVKDIVFFFNMFIFIFLFLFTYIGFIHCLCSSRKLIFELLVRRYLNAVGVHIDYFHDFPTEVLSGNVVLMTLKNCLLLC
ncbi:Myrosinase-binding protein-like [Platanthera zijinensis]|uniref:Myrosinase-binding protein-like n=1 Tax=Platanthera zijinensis TaxID=2320716 RepID=A0AAP0BRP1_9ASPA